MPTTTNFGWTTPADTDLVKDGALAIRTLGNGVDTSLVDLKGGATGDSLVKASATDLDYNWTRLADQVLANPVINGGMDIFQRGTSSLVTATSSANGFTADRWQLWRAAFAAGATASRQTTSDTTNLPNISYSCRVQRDSGNTSTAETFLTQTFENDNSKPLIGKTVTLSFYAKAGANYSPTSSILKVKVTSGTGTNQSVTAAITGDTTVASGNITLTTSWQRFVITGTIGSTAAQLFILFSMVPVGTAGANDWFEVTGVQLDVGTFTAANAPAFRRSGGTIQGELAACQRYYYRATDNSTADSMGVFGIATSTTNVLGSLQFPVSMRVQPTSVDYTNLRAYDGVTATAITAVALSNPSPEVAQCTFTVASGLTQYRFYGVVGNTGNGYLGFSAEL